MHADHAIDHGLALGCGHRAEALDLSLVADAGDVEHVETEAQDFDHLGVERPRAGRERRVSPVDGATFERAINTVVAPTHGHREMAVILPHSAQRRGAEEAVTYHLDHEALSSFVGARDRREASPELESLGEATPGRLEAHGVGKVSDHASTAAFSTVLVFVFVMNTPPASHCLWRGGRVLPFCGT